MSTPTANTVVTTTTTTSSGLNIGLIIGGVILAVILMVAAVYFFKRRRNAGVSAPTSANGLGAMNQGPNAVPRTNMNLNAGRTTI